MDWENHLEKSDPKNGEKNSKNQSEIAACEQQTLANRIFVQTPFSYSTLKVERKKFKPQNHSLFRSTSCFGVTKITTPI